MSDLADLLVANVRELHDVRFERDAYRLWFRASLDSLHEQHVAIEKQRQQLAYQREQLRRVVDEARTLREALFALDKETAA